MSDFYDTAADPLGDRSVTIVNHNEPIIHTQINSGVNPLTAYLGRQFE